MTYNWIIIPSVGEHPDSLAAQDKKNLALSLIIGHEQITDDPPINVLSQPFSPIEYDVHLWDQAVEFDSKGQNRWRDDALWAILNFPDSVPMGGIQRNRVGNSLQDLRLSLKGYRFAHWVWNNPNTFPSSAGGWLRRNIGIPSLLRD